jgi:hypothetical protein
VDPTIKPTKRKTPMRPLVGWNSPVNPFPTLTASLVALGVILAALVVDLLLAV